MGPYERIESAAGDGVSRRVQELVAACQSPDANSHAITAAWHDQPADIRGILEEVRVLLDRCPKPEYDCIVLTDAAWAAFKRLSQLEYLIEPRFPVELCGLEVFSAATAAKAVYVAEQLSRAGRRPLLVTEGRPEDYGPSPVAEQLEAWWKLNLAEFGPTMVPPCLRDISPDRILREAMELTGYPIKHVVTSQGFMTLNAEGTKTVTLPGPGMPDGTVVTIAGHRWTNIDSDPALRETAPRVLPDGTTVHAVGWTYLGLEADTPVTVQAKPSPLEDGL